MPKLREHFVPVESLSDITLQQSGVRASRFIDITSGAAVVGMAEMGAAFAKLVRVGEMSSSERMASLLLGFSLCGIASLNVVYQRRFIDLMCESLDRYVPIRQPKVYALIRRFSYGKW